MAIAHLASQIIKSHRSVVGCAAYRHRTTMVDASTGEVWRYPPDANLVHSEMTLPANAPAWARAAYGTPKPAAASATLWNDITRKEASTRADAQLAREFIIALPIELTAQQNLGLARDYIQTELAGRGFVTDWVFHDEPGNPHLHVMHPLRPLTETGWGNKRTALTDEHGEVLRTASGKLRTVHFTGQVEQLQALRDGWETAVNNHLAAAGIDRMISVKSYKKRGIPFSPTVHLVF